MVIAVEKVFSFRPDWHQDNQAKLLVGQYQRTLDSVLQAHCRLQSRVAHCVRCGIRFLTWPQNAGRHDLRCPFGCRQHHRRQSSNRRSAAYYQTDEGKDKKRRLNARRGGTVSPPSDSDTSPADSQPRQLPPTQSPASQLPHECFTETRDEVSVKVELPLEGVTLDEATLVHSPMLAYARMMVNLIDGLELSLDELVAVLRKRLRQHSMCKRRRIDYVLHFLHQHPP